MEILLFKGHLTGTAHCGSTICDCWVVAIAKSCGTVMGILSGIIHFVESNITNAILESINSKIQLAKRRARGFRNINNYINMIYFLCGKLTFAYPRYFT